MGVIRARPGVRAGAGAAAQAQARVAVPAAGTVRGRASGLAFDFGETQAPAAGPRLAVSRPTDPAEREADALAAQVLSEAGARAAPEGPGWRHQGKPVVQRECAACAEEDDEKKAGATKGTVHRHGEGDAVVTPAVAQALRGMAGAGVPLPEGERRFFEGRFGYELSRVRIHDDARAAETARDLNAHAFTLGNEVAFAAGRYRPDTPGGRRLLAHELAHVVQQGSASPLPGGTALPVSSGGGPVVARKVDSMTPESAAPAAAGPAAANAAPAAGGLVVEDEALTLLSGQMRKSTFLAQLRQSGCAAADEVLVRAGRSTEGCPYLERALAFYAGRPPAYVERAARKMVGGANVRSAVELVPLVAERIAGGVQAWLITGALPGNLPDELQAAMPGGGGVMSAGAEAASGGGRLSFKERPSGANRGADPTALAARLGPGRPLDGSTRTRMESAFGESLGGVRIHDDAAAAGASRDLNAHAFALGSHVAFARDSYRPGTPVGDALLAHELAHVVQQGGAAHALAGRVGSGGAAEPQLALEEDADAAAAGVVAALWGGGEETRGSRSARPRGRTGLSLQRCRDDEKAKEKKADAKKPEAKPDAKKPDAKKPDAKKPAPKEPEDEKPTAAKPKFGSVQKIVDYIKKCDGGTGIWKAAKLANGNKDPVVIAGKPARGNGGETDAETGVITIDFEWIDCYATQALAHELSNLSRIADLKKIVAEAKKGNVSREDYMRGLERIEYETGVANTLKAAGACTENWGWGCSPSAEPYFKDFIGTKSFEDYLSRLKPSHKADYEKAWDEYFKDAWNAKHK